MMSRVWHRSDDKTLKDIIYVLFYVNELAEVFKESLCKEKSISANFYREFKGPNYFKIQDW